MLKLFRMYRFTSRVQKSIKEVYGDGFLRAFNDEAGFDNFAVSRHDTIAAYKPRFARDKEFVAEQICRAAVKHEYLEETPKGELALTYGVSGGYRLIDGYGWGFLREAITQEWKFFALLLPVIAAALGSIITYQLTRHV